jgi:hypothetical protein
MASASTTQQATSGNLIALIAVILSALAIAVSMIVVVVHRS